LWSAYDSSEEESFGRFAQYIDYPKEMPFPNMRFECGGPECVTLPEAPRFDSPPPRFSPVAPWRRQHTRGLRMMDGKLLLVNNAEGLFAHM